MASRPGRKNGNWRTPEGRLMRCVLNVLIKDLGRDRAKVVNEFKRLCPDSQVFHHSPITDGAIWGRATTGVDPRKEREHPDKNPHIAKYMPAAVNIVREGRPVSADEIRRLVAEIDALPGERASSRAEPAAPPTQPGTVVEEKHAALVRRLLENGYPGVAAELLAGGHPVIPGMPGDDDDPEEYEGLQTETGGSSPSPPAATVSVPTRAAELRIHLGDAYHYRKPVYWIPADQMNFGMLVTGDSGSGKTQVLRAVIDGVARAGLPVAIFDFKNDYAGADFAGALGMRVYDVDRNGLPFNPFALVADDRGEVQPIRHAHEFAGILQRALRLGDVQMARLKDAVATAYRNRRIEPMERHQLASVPPPPSFAEVVEALSKGDQDCERLLARLGPLQDLALFPTSEVVSTEFGALLGDRVVFDLHRLPNDQIKAAMAEFFVARLHGHLLRGDQPHEFRRLLVFDEAHRMAKNNRLVALAREGRAFGVGLAIGTQFPGDVLLELSGNLAAKLFLHNGEEKHRRAVAKTLVGTGYAAEPVMRELGRLRQHQALVQLSSGGYVSVDLLPHYRRLPISAAAE